MTRCSRLWINSCCVKARISRASLSGTPSRCAFTASMNIASPRGKVTDSAVWNAEAIGSPFSHPRPCRSARPKRMSRGGTDRAAGDGDRERLEIWVLQCQGGDGAGKKGFVTKKNGKNVG